MSKGCGCQSGLLRYLPLPYAHYFYVACAMHDDDYERGGTARDRQRADVQLFDRMLLTIRNHFEPPLKTWWLTTVALGYYAAVRLMGWHYYKYR